MKVTKKLLSIPPYLSTGWENVGALRVDGDPATLIVQLVDGTNVRVPDLDRQTVQRIFLTHEQFLEDSRGPEEMASPRFNFGDQVMGLPMRFGIGGFEGIGGPGALMEHDPSQSSAPDLPSEILEKVVGVAQVLGAGEGTQIPEPMRDCNCFHCQIARAVRGIDTSHDDEEEGEEVLDEELSFKTWNIEDQGGRLYSVSDPLNPNEKYRVFLGEPVGCTCGQKGCEHIHAVLKT